MTLVSQLKESFAIAPIKDREEIVKKLAADNTEDAFYYQGLIILQKIYDQVMKYEDPVKPREPNSIEKELSCEMKTLLAKFKTHNNQFYELNARFHLLIYPFDTAASVEFIKTSLHLDLQQSTDNDKPILTIDNYKDQSDSSPTDVRTRSTTPSIFNKQLIDSTELIKQSFKRLSSEDTVLDINSFAFPYLESFWKDLNEDEETALLIRIFDFPSEHVFGPKIIDRLAKLWKTQIDQNSAPSKNFENLPFQNLTIAQMEQLIDTIPDIVFLYENFILTYLEKLAPTEYYDIQFDQPISFWDDDGNILNSYLERLDAFVNKLPPIYYQLKSAVKFHRLRVDIVRKAFDMERFIKYLSGATLNTSANLTPTPSHIGFRQAFNDNRNINSEPNHNLSIPFMGSCNISESDKHSMIKDYLTGLVQQNKLTMSIQSLGAFIDFHNFLKPLYAKIMLTNASSTTQESWINDLGFDEYKALINKTIVSFSPSTSKKSYKRKPTDDICLEVITKNISCLTIRVFQIETENYWRLHLNDTIDDETTANNKIKLDGLQPTFETDINSFSSVPALHVETTKFEFGGQNGLAQDVFNGRGLWVIDFVGGQHQCKAIVQKGYLKYVMQQTCAGHVFRILDEEGFTIEKTKIWCNNQYYESDDHNNILIPYLPPDEDAKMTKMIMMSCKDGFCEVGTFYHLTEQYKLEASFYVNPEMTYSNKKSRVIVIPKLTLNGLAIPLSLIEERMSLVVESSTVKDVKKSSTYQNIPYNTNPIIFEFVVPDQLVKLNFRLVAKIKTLRGTLQNLEASHTILNKPTINNSGIPASIHLSKSRNNTYTLHAFGKNGEIRKDCEVSLRLKHLCVDRVVETLLKTNEKGIIQLGDMKDIIWIECSCARSTYKQYFLKDTFRAILPSSFCISPNTLFKISCSTDFHDAMYSLYEIGLQEMIIKDLTSHIVKEDNSITIQGLPEGEYRLYIASPIGQIEEINFTVIQSQQDSSENQQDLWSEWIIGDNKYAKQCKTLLQRPLGISDVKLSDEIIKIKLRNWSSKTFAIVTTNTFVHAHNETIANCILDRKQLPDYNTYKNGVLATRSIILDDKLISDEYQYILNRSRAEKWIGSNLTKPSLLICPKKRTITDSNLRHINQERVLLKQKGIQRYAHPASLQSRMMKTCDINPVSNCYDILDNNNTSDLSLDFLDHNSSILLSSVSDNDGFITIDRNALGQGGQILQVIIISDEQAISYQTVLNDEQTLRYKDLRQNADSNKALICARTISNLLPGNTLKLNTHEYEIIDSVEKLFDTIKLISPVGKAFAEEFYFLKTWSSLTLEEKLKIYEKHACHEFNLWLKKKNNAFFNNYIKFAIQSKIQKSFMDLYLLDEDLSTYCQSIYKFNQLSMVEKTLLATTQSKEFLQMVLKIFKEQFDDKELNNSSDTIFDSILAHSTISDEEPIHTNASKSFTESEECMTSNFMAQETPSGSFYPFLNQSSAYPSAALFGSAPRTAMPLPNNTSNLFGASSTASNTLLYSNVSTDDDEGPVDNLQLNNTEDEVYKLREKAREDQKKASYKFIGSTSEWSEIGYYNDSVQVALKQFWIDYLKCYNARNNRESLLFLSGNFIHALDSITEVLYVMSLIDLPFSSKTNWNIEVHDMSDLIISTSTYPLMVFHRTLTESQEKHLASNNQNSLILCQELFIVDDSMSIQTEDLIKISPESQPLETQVEYGTHLILSNISSKTLVCQILAQIPVGSVPSQNTPYCNSKTISIEPYSSWHDVVGTFYFPEAGNFSMTPITVTSSSGDQFLGLIDSVDICVINQTTNSNVTSETNSTPLMSWAIITASNDTNIIKYLETCRTLDKLDFTLIGWRMTDKMFARHVFDILIKRRFFSRDLWKYGISHQFEDIIRDLLYYEKYQLLESVGHVFESPLIYENKMENQELKVLDYYPLLNARIHSIKNSTNEILNQQFFKQYNEFLSYLCLKSTPCTANELIILTLYLLLQDRIGEAHSTFARINREKIASCQVQYDYVDAYLKTRIPINADNQLQILDLQSIKDTTQKYKEFGILKWRKLFTDLYNFICEVEQGDLAISDDTLSSKNIHSEPILEFEIDQHSNEFVIQYANLKTIDIKYYEMNIEVMFSDNPFMINQNVSQQSSMPYNKFNWIKPSYTTTINLPKQTNMLDDFEVIGVSQLNSLQTVRIPFKDGHKNIFVEVSSDSLKRYQAFFSNRLSIHVVESLGVIRVMNEHTKYPIAGAYVKVYVRMKQGHKVEFWKDGYTGLNGVFDYVGVTEGNALVGNQQDLKMLMENKIDKLSILVLSNEDGAMVKEAYPPLISH